MQTLTNKLVWLASLNEATTNWHCQNGSQFTAQLCRASRTPVLSVITQTSQSSVLHTSRRQKEEMWRKESRTSNILWMNAAAPFRSPNSFIFLAVVTNTRLNPEAKGRTTTEKGRKDPYLFAKSANYGTVLYCTTRTRGPFKAGMRELCSPTNTVWLLWSLVEWLSTISRTLGPLATI